MEKDLLYEARNVIKYNDEICIKCKNYEICKSVVPRSCGYNWRYICSDCDLDFGTCRVINHDRPRGLLKISDGLECLKCHKTGRVVQHNCEHVLCIECFKVCYYGKPLTYIERPLFPYPNVPGLEYDYKNDPTNSILNIKYPFLKKYTIELEVYNKEMAEYQVYQKFGRRCPMCV